MEKREGVKMEDILGNYSSYSDYIGINNSIFDIMMSSEGTGDTNTMQPLGFMELLQGVPPLFDHMAPLQQVVVPSLVTQAAASSCLNPPSMKTTKIESPSEVFNQPATPNTSSISSASSEAVNDETVKQIDDQEEDYQKTKKQLKPKKTNQKRQKEPRFAFMTKSEVDHLEDGYRWRKYGQKAVKNSPFPRSYYRCTTASCNVKKRVERSFSDPSIVVTTYEGQHTHPSPLMPRPSLGAGAGGAHLSSGFSGARAGAGARAAPTFGMPIMQRTPSHYQQPFPNNILSPLNVGRIVSISNASSVHDHQQRFCTPADPSLVKDHGLLQDIIPSHMLKEE